MWCQRFAPVLELQSVSHPSIIYTGHPLKLGLVILEKIRRAGHTLIKKQTVFVISDDFPSLFTGSHRDVRRIYTQTTPAGFEREVHSGLVTSLSQGWERRTPESPLHSQPHIEKTLAHNNLQLLWYYCGILNNHMHGRKCKDHDDEIKWNRMNTVRHLAR